ncbi:hypothetical protein BFP70_10680 [Thioclava sp. SK-1]|uniref:aldose epimerase family protein n=1 Tax=Thioclava sp. SK-1 TaxID=1889770 RepID=UPI0008246D84|nr:aldose epimerase family protein [Thioclava sp. SK-1]OCX64501.1 hypothetical protein BFP70_10680 [Thioclava sp. SK-1]
MTPRPQVQIFGHLPDGRAVECVTLALDNVTVRIMTFGAAVQALLCPDADGVVDDIVLGHDTLDGYLAHRSFFGATIGRVANRIAGGQVVVQGRHHDLSRNEGTTCLHGGAQGFDRRLWKLLDHSATHVTLSLTSPDGDQGFPGQVDLQLTYDLRAADPDKGGGVVLGLSYVAQTDAPTPLALTHHSYFALAGGRALAARPKSALEMQITAPAARYLPVGPDLIPHAPAPVGATPFDFRNMRQPLTAIRSGLLADYDHCLCLDEGWLRLCDPGSGRCLHLQTDQPAVQLYTGGQLSGAVSGKGGRAYRAHDALCLEPQPWPNGMNMPAHWGAPDMIYGPHRPYSQKMQLHLFAQGRQV